MKNSTYLLLSLLFCCMSAFPKEITIHTIGDSTMESKPEDTESNPNGQRGWAQMLQQFVTNGATVKAELVPNLFMKPKTTTIIIVFGQP